MSWWGWLLSGGAGGVMVLVAISLVLDVIEGRRPSPASEPTWPPVGWHVDVGPAARWITRNGTHPWEIEGVNITDSVHVRVQGPGSSVLIATVNLTDDDYEQQLLDAQARAEERVATLTAMGV